ncbi:MAG: HD domain-containing protein [Coriobacteriales bacterium]|jgi:(p)ppGpp synthase/HD superfamily hydrolase|nr:HD domain-containing protein [Coriobacteriales bacterium]
MSEASDCSMATLNERAEKLAHRIHNGNCLVDPGDILRAYRMAARLHEGQTRASGEPYISHPLTVAEILSQFLWDRELAMAALLHDVVEDTVYTLERLESDFDPITAQIVDALTEVKRPLPEDLNDERKREIKDYLDGLTNAKTLNSPAGVRIRAVLIRLADRLHNMQTLGAMARNKQVKKAQDTQRFLVPLAAHIGAHYFEEELAELCFAVLEADLHLALQQRYQQIRESNGRAIAAFMRELHAIMCLSYREIAPLDAQPPFQHKRDQPLKTYQLKQLLERSGQSYDPAAFAKEDIYLYAINLALNDYRDDQPLQRFLELYWQHLRPQQVAMQLELSGSEPYPTVVLTDALDNRYLIRLLTADQQAAYDIGLGTAAEADLSVPQDTPSTYFPIRKINVYTKDMQPIRLDDGATVLDLACILHPDIGISARYGLIRRHDNNFIDITEAQTREERLAADTHHSLGTRLRDGDIVKIVFACDADGRPLYQANLHWFKYVTMEYSQNLLIEYFEKAAAAGQYVAPAKTLIDWEPSKYGKAARPAR